MKRLFVIFVLCSVVCGWAMAMNKKPFLVPEVKEWQGGRGKLKLSHRIVEQSPSLNDVVQALVNDYAHICEGVLTVASMPEVSGDVVLELDDDSLRYGHEGYRIAIDNVVRITAATPRGVYWATQTLLQLIEQYGDALPRGTIDDAPTYALRGCMIDCGRKFIPMSYLRKLVRVMSYYKMNALQLHLNDNGFVQFFGNDWLKTQAAFRLECDTYRGLTATDGAYSKQEFVELQRYADSCGVEIIPEIDAPAHALAFTQFRPSLASKEYGMDHLDLMNPAVYQFMDSLWMEYLGGENPVFRGGRVHIGTDEYSNSKQEVVEAFRSYTNRYIQLVEQYGKQAVMWGALTHARGETTVKSDGVLMSCWNNGFANPEQMKKQGYRIVSIPDHMVYIVPGADYYHDFLDYRWLYENWTPAVVGDCVFEEGDSSIEGGMFAVWNDHVGNGITVKDIHYRLFPALQTLATKCWTASKVSMPYNRFEQQCKILSEAPAVNELGRIGTQGAVVLELDTLCSDTILPYEEVGYNYSVSFVVDGAVEEHGTVLLESTNAVVYLADPLTGCFAFEREGYLSTFNYRIEPNKRAEVTMEGDAAGVTLRVDGKLVQRLDKEKLVVTRPCDRVNYQLEQDSLFVPMVYRVKEYLNFHHTLFFPLRKAGRFNSTITHLKVTMK